MISSQHRADRDVELFAGGLPQSMLECRELGHAWRPHTARWNEAERVYDRTLKCRCGTFRIETLSRRGEIISRRYEYPEGYLSRDLGRISGSGRDALRRESLMRQVRQVG